MAKKCKQCGELLPPTITRDFQGRPLERHECPQAWFVAVDSCDYSTESRDPASIALDDCQVLYGDDPQEVLERYVEEHHCDWDYPGVTVCYIKKHPSWLTDNPWRRMVVEAEQRTVFHAYARDE